MKKRRNKYNGPLHLDAIYDSDDPAIQEAMCQFLAEEKDAALEKAKILIIQKALDEATERATIRLAHKFRHLLPPLMQARLDHQYPLSSFAATA